MKKEFQSIMRREIEKAISNHDGLNVRLTNKCFAALKKVGSLEHARLWAGYYMMSRQEDDYREIIRACENAVCKLHYS